MSPAWEAGVLSTAHSLGAKGMISSIQMAAARAGHSLRLQQLFNRPSAEVTVDARCAGLDYCFTFWCPRVRRWLTLVG